MNTKLLIGLGVAGAIGVLVFLKSRKSQAQGPSTSTNATGPSMGAAPPRQGDAVRMGQGSSSGRAGLAGEPKQQTPGGGLVKLPFMPAMPGRVPMGMSDQPGFAKTAPAMATIQDRAGGGAGQGSGTRTYNPQNLGGKKSSEFAFPQTNSRVPAGTEQAQTQRTLERGYDVDPGYSRTGGRRPASTDPAESQPRWQSTGRMGRTGTAEGTSSFGLKTILGQKEPGAVKARESANRGETQASSLPKYNRSLANIYNNAAADLERGGDVDVRWR